MTDTFSEIVPNFTESKILDTLPLLIWINSADGMEVVYYNAKWYEYLQQPKEAVLGINWAQIVHPSDFERVVRVITEAINKQQGYELEVRLYRKQKQTYYWFLCRCEPVRDVNNVVKYWVGTSMDINETKMRFSVLEEELQLQLNEKLDHLARTRKEIEVLEGKLQKV